MRRLLDEVDEIPNPIPEGALFELKTLETPPGLFSPKRPISVSTEPVQAGGVQGGEED